MSHLKTYNDKNASEKETEPRLWNFHFMIAPISPKRLVNSIATRDSEGPGFEVSDMKRDEKLLGEAEVSLSTYMKTLEDYFGRTAVVREIFFSWNVMALAAA